MTLLVIAVALGVVALVLAVLSLRLRSSLATLRERFAPVLSADAEAAAILDRAKHTAQTVRAEADDAAARVRREAEALAQDIAARRQEWTAEQDSQARQRATLAAEYQRGLEVYNRLKAEVSLLEENLEDMSVGLYRPHFDFDSSEDYKRELERVRQAQKAMVRAETAAVCHAEWEVGGSRREGERMTKQYVKLLLRAFNGESDAAVARVSWNNVTTMEERIRKAYEALNKLGTVMKMAVTVGYLELKLQELRLAHEYEEKRQQEREEERRQRELMREEERAQREFAAAAEQADKTERTTTKALERVRREVAAAHGAERAALEAKIRELEEQIATAQAQKQRALAQAQLTRSGYVYILSNVGAFGEDVVKIGMTRRLEPRERVAELGDASVPFPFDLHGLIYTENAPQLETEFHDHFWERRLNLANNRKEFFRLPLADVERYIRERNLTCQFISAAEAKEFRQTCAAREQASAAMQRRAATESAFPTEVFASAG